MTDAEFRDAYRAHKDVLYRFVRRMTNSAEAAEEIVHDAFLAVWRSTSTFDSARGTLRSFLLGVARNLALQYLRRERPYDELQEEAAIAAPIDLAGVERTECVARAVAELPALQREALILAEYEEMSLKKSPAPPMPSSPPSNRACIAH